MKTLLVAIGGASSSGKTADSEIPIDEKTGEQNWDCPEALNFDAFVKELGHLRNRGQRSQNKDGLQYESDTKDQDLSGVSPGVVESIRLQLEPLVRDTKVILVDGFMLFHDPTIIKLFDVRIFVKCSYDTLKRRRNKRNGYVTSESFWVDPPNYFDDIVYPSYARSHSRLFLHGDVEQDLDPTVKKKLDIFSITNNDESSLDDALVAVGKHLTMQLQSI